MKPPIFDSIRWGELLGWLTGLVGVLQWLQTLPLPESYKHYITLGLTAFAYILSYLRNPKTLAWLANPRGIPPAPPGYVDASPEIRTDRSDEI